MKIIAENRKALHDFSIEQKFEVGMVLSGSEIKSIKLGKANLKDSYVIVKNGELFLVGMHISTYDKTSNFILDQQRTRKLLAHHSEIEKLKRMVDIKGYSVVPLKLYLKSGLAKLEIAVAKGKLQFQKKQMLKDRQIQREINRIMKFK